MPIYQNNKKLKAFKNRYEPINIYKGNIKLAGWVNDTKSGQSVEFSETYNDKALVDIVGESTQITSVQGKNIIDCSKFQTPRADTTATWDGTSLTVTGLWYVEVLIYVKRNTNYRLSYINSGSHNNVAIFTTSNGVDVGSPVYIASKQFNSGENDRLLVLFYSGNGTSGTSVYSNIQIEEGIETSYEPFIPNSPSPNYSSEIKSVGTYNPDTSKYEFDVVSSNRILTAEELVVIPYNTSTDGVHKIAISLDEPLGGLMEKDRIFRDIDGLWKVQREYDNKVFDGTEGLTLATRLTNTVRIYFNTNGLSGGNLNTLNCISTHFIPILSGVDAEGCCLTGPGVTGLLNIKISYTRLGMNSSNTDTEIVNALKTWLATEFNAGHPFTMYYKLATPAIETLANEMQISLNSLKTFYPQTYIYTANTEIKPNLIATAKVIDTEV